MTSAELLTVSTLTDDQAAAVRGLVVAVPGSTESPALSEHALLHLQAGPPVRHLIATAPSGGGAAALIGYAQLEDQPDGTTTIELVAGPTAAAGPVTAADSSEPTAVAGALLAAVTEGTDRPLLVWAHGQASPVNTAAEQSGWRPVRSLFQLRRPLAGLDTGDLTPPPGVTVRAFVPGQDDAGWLAVNAAAFAHHPEQGSWTQTDLDDRLRADWFDPAGFLVAERDSELIGYHWTKVHPATDAAALGEVYVLGVAPAALGLHLGSLLLRAGLAHLQQLGLSTVLLYVDESNTSAVRLYRGLGFGTYSTDVQWARP